MAPPQRYIPRPKNKLCLSCFVILHVTTYGCRYVCRLVCRRTSYNSLILIIAGASADASADASTDKFLKKLCFSLFFVTFLNSQLPKAYLRLGVTFIGRYSPSKKYISK